MTTDEVREKYLNFFKAKPRNHKEISPAPLVLQEDPSTLFTSSGMQPLIPYLMGESHPEGKRLVNSQPSIRLGDIDEVGDNRHTTFFEMLGNWSLGDYWKKEQLTWFWEFLTKVLKLPKERIWVSVFEGNSKIPKDEESAEIWKSLGVDEKRIFYYGVDKNWWSRSGTPDEMPEGEIGGPDSEVFYEFTQVKHNKRYGKVCHPNCDCGRFLEIGNSVFIQYKKKKNGALEELPQKNVDFGGGLERLVAATLNKPDIYQIDIFKPLIEKLEEYFDVKYGNKAEIDRMYRIVADHVRASVFLAKSGVQPSNKLQGYILRKLLRRAAAKTFVKKKEFDSKKFESLVNIVIDSYKLDLKKTNQKEIRQVIGHEIRKFRANIERGFNKINKIKTIDAKTAFDLYQSFGFPLELTEEIAEEKGQKINKKEFEKEFKKHQEKSRSASAGMFAGGLADHSEEVTKLHTVTHLLHASLRKILGNHVEQKGSNVTAERLRFDFSHPEKLTEDQIKEVEDLVNEQIAKDLPVSHETKSYEDAVKAGALAFFGDKYGEKVKVYTVGDPAGEYFSKEVCGGPHVENTREIGRVKIKKQEKIGAGLVRLYAVIE